MTSLSDLCFGNSFSQPWTNLRVPDWPRRVFAHSFAPKAQLQQNEMPLSCAVAHTAVFVSLTQNALVPSRLGQAVKRISDDVNQPELLW